MFLNTTCFQSHTTIMCFGPVVLQSWCCTMYVFLCGADVSLPFGPLPNDKNKGIEEIHAMHSRDCRKCLCLRRELCLQPRRTHTQCSSVFALELFSSCHSAFECGWRRLFWTCLASAVAFDVAALIKLSDRSNRAAACLHWKGLLRWRQRKPGQNPTRVLFAFVWFRGAALVALNIS